MLPYKSKSQLSYNTRSQTTNNLNQKGTNTMEQKSNKRAPVLSLNKQISTKRKLVGHEHMLQRLKEDARRVKFVMTSENVVEGIVTNFDKYTITVAMPKNINGTETACLYKHGIEAIIYSEE